MRCHADGSMLQHADGQRRLILKAQRRKEKRNSRMPPVAVTKSDYRGITAAESSHQRKAMENEYDIKKTV